MLESARDALELWALQIVPSLFPFMILTNLLSAFINRYFSIDCRYLIILLGNICGYPIGAKLTAQYYKESKLTQNDANFVLSLCNQSSPAFLEFYVGIYALNRQISTPVLFILFYISTIITRFITKKIFPSMKSPVPKIHTVFKMNWFQTLDYSIVDSCKTMLSIGGYILLFSVLMNLMADLLKSLGQYGYLVVSMLEITNGIELLKKHFSQESIYPYYILFLTGFGGLCTMAQIKGMLTGTSLSLKPYIIGKIIYTTILLLLYSLFKIFSFCF